MSKTERRPFLKVAGSAAAAGLLGGLGASTSEAANGEFEVSGTSTGFNIQGALEAAIAAAFAQKPYPDALLIFRVHSIEGLGGGIAGFTDVTVTIIGSWS